MLDLVADSYIVVLYERLIEQNFLFEEAVNLTLSDLFSDLLRLAVLDSISLVAFDFSFNEIGGNLLTRDINRIHGSHLQANVFQQILELFGLSYEVGFAIELYQHANFTSVVHVATNAAFSSSTGSLALSLGHTFAAEPLLSLLDIAIGDTITVPGKKFTYSGIPTFAPEHFARVSAKDSMKRKQFVKGTEQIAQEGAIQIFKVPNSGMEEVIVGVVGTLQFDVFVYRMKNEYGVDLRMETLPYEEIRLIDSYPGDLADLNLGSDAELLEDYKGRSLLVFSSYWAIDFTCRRNPGLKVSEIVVSEG